MTEKAMLRAAAGFRPGQQGPVRSVVMPRTRLRPGRRVGDPYARAHRRRIRRPAARVRPRRSCDSGRSGDAGPALCKPASTELRARFPGCRPRTTDIHRSGMTTWHAAQRCSSMIAAAAMARVQVRFEGLWHAVDPGRHQHFLSPIFDVAHGSGAPRTSRPRPPLHDPATPPCLERAMRARLRPAGLPASSSRNGPPRAALLRNIGPVRGIGSRFSWNAMPQPAISDNAASLAAGVATGPDSPVAASSAGCRFSALHPSARVPLRRGFRRPARFVVQCRNRSRPWLRQRFVRHLHGIGAEPSAATGSLASGTIAASATASTFVRRHARHPSRSREQLRRTCARPLLQPSWSAVSASAPPVANSGAAAAATGPGAGACRPPPLVERAEHRMTVAVERPDAHPVAEGRNSRGLVAASVGGLSPAVSTGAAAASACVGRAGAVRAAVSGFLLVSSASAALAM